MFNSFYINLLEFKPEKLTSIFSSFLLIGILFLCNIQLMAQGGLVVTPHRVIFEGSKKIMNVSLINSGKDSANYNISFLQYRVSDDGSYAEITTPDPDQNFADKYIRFFPRSITMGPNETQIVKLQLINSDGMLPGEYRSHLYFRSIPMQNALGEDDAKKDTSGISIKIVPVFGISIPIQIRIGESTSVLNITDLKIDKSDNATKRLLLTIHRTGNMSVVFDISVKYIDQNGKETQIGSMEGMVVYTPNLLRKFKIELENKPSVDLSKGKIRVTCSNKNGSNNVIKLAESEIIL